MEDTRLLRQAGFLQEELSALSVRIVCKEFLREESKKEDYVLQCFISSNFRSGGSTHPCGSGCQ